jgi:excinuclease UvrABC helicase subunit UvrB
LEAPEEQDYYTVPVKAEGEEVDLEDIPAELEKLRKEMKTAAEALDFETAAEKRDRIKELEELALTIGVKT